MTQSKVLKYQFLPEGRAPGPHAYLCPPTSVTRLITVLSQFGVARRADICVCVIECYSAPRWPTHPCPFAFPCFAALGTDSSTGF